AIRVVVSLLRAPDLVSAAKHRYALRKEQGRQEVAHLPPAPGEDVPVFTRPLLAAVPRTVVAFAVAVLFAICVVALLVVGNEIAQREAIVRGDEVDAGVRPPGCALVKVRAAGVSRAEFRERAVAAAPEV